MQQAVRVVQGFGVSLGPTETAWVVSKTEILVSKTEIPGDSWDVG